MKINFKYINIAVFLIANILYFFLACSEVFYYDEAYTVGMIYRDFGDIVTITSRDVHSPLYYILLKMFYFFPGMQSLISTRLFSWLFMCLYLIVGGRICRKLYDRKVEFYWLLLSGFMPAMLIQATNARMYAMALFFVTLSSYLAYSLYKEESKRKWILFTLTAIVAVYIHTFCMIEMVIVYALFLLAVLLRKEYKKAVRVIVSGLVVSVSFMPWLVVLYHQFRRWAGKEEGWGNTIEQLSWNSLNDYLAEWFSSLERPNSYMIWFSIILIIISFIHCMRYMIKNRDFFPGLGVVVAGITFVIAMLVSLFIVPCFLGRYLFPVFGGIWLLVALGMSRIKYLWIRVPLIIGILVCSFVTFREQLQLREADGLNQYLTYMDSEWEEGDVIMCDSYFASMMSIYYPDAEYMVYGWMPDCLPFDNTTVFTKYEQLQDADTVWYISLEMRNGNLDQKFTSVERFVIPYSYYNLVIEKYVR